MSKTLIALLFFLFLPGAVIAELYKWVDDAGNVHYGDTPPSKIQSEKMKPAPAADEKEAQRLKQRTDKILQQQNEAEVSRTKEKQALKKGESEKMSIEKRCKYANAELVFYKKRGKHTVLDQEGNLTKVNPAERKQKITELKSFIDENC
jgi:aspartate-semialdehyde dehydrogenase